MPILGHYPIFAGFLVASFNNNARPTVAQPQHVRCGFRHLQHRYARSTLVYTSPCAGDVRDIG